MITWSKEIQNTKIFHKEMKFTLKYIKNLVIQKIEK